jgi:hypothetical protein
MNWIVKILSKEPYKVTCRWNDQIIRTIDLEPFLRKKSVKPDDSYSQLLDTKRFLEVKCDGTTLYWENGITLTDLNGGKQPAPLDIDPEVLFEMTSSIVGISPKSRIKYKPQRR